MSSDKIDASTIYAMFEELKSSQQSKGGGTEQFLPVLDDIARCMAEVVGKTESYCNKVIAKTADCCARIEAAGEMMADSATSRGPASPTGTAAPEPNRPLRVEYRHRYTIDFKVARPRLWIVVLAVLVIIEWAIIRGNFQTIRRCADNDLKYRYIQMTGRASGEDLTRLENTFTWQRNSDSIRIIRHTVEHYERLLRQQAEQQTRNQLNELRSEKIKQQVDKLQWRK